MTDGEIFQANKQLLQWKSTSVFSGTTTTVGAYVDIDSTNGKIDITTRGGDLEVDWSGYVLNNTATGLSGVAIRLDALAEVGLNYSHDAVANLYVPMSGKWRFTGVVPGAHTVYWRHFLATGTSQFTAISYCSVKEIKAPS